MKLTCNVEVSHRLLPTLPIKTPRSKAQRACLSIGKTSNKSKDVYLMFQTQANKTGLKYKVNATFKYLLFFV